MDLAYSLTLVVAIATVQPAQSAPLRLSAEGEARAAILLATDATEVERTAAAELATFLDVFPWCQVYFGQQSTNAILVSPASPAVRELTVEEATRQAVTLQEKHKFAFDFAGIVPSRLRPNTRPQPGAQVLTDDKAPVNLLRGQRRR